MTIRMTEDERWLHDLRNAVNTTGMALAVTRKLLESGDTARALSFLANAATGCETCRVLLHSASDSAPRLSDSTSRDAPSA